MLRDKRSKDRETRNMSEKSLSLNSLYQIRLNKNGDDLIVPVPRWSFTSQSREGLTLRKRSLNVFLTPLVSRLRFSSSFFRSTTLKSAKRRPSPSDAMFADRKRTACLTLRNTTLDFQKSLAMRNLGRRDRGRGWGEGKVVFLLNICGGRYIFLAKRL